MPETNGIETFRERYLSGENEFDLIIIMLGTNDLLNHFKCTAEKTAAALRTYVRECKERFGEKCPKILLVSPIHVRDYVLKNPIFMTQYSNFAVMESRRFAQCIAETAEQEGAYFLDAAKAASASPIDGVHMDSSEHEKLAVAIAAKIKSILF
jgi:lysophospholipase L1-like esterase